jgi:hypothetical protein
MPLNLQSSCLSLLSSGIYRHMPSLLAYQAVFIRPVAMGEREPDGKYTGFRDNSLPPSPLMQNCATPTYTRGQGTMFRKGQRMNTLILCANTQSSVSGQPQSGDRALFSCKLLKLCCSPFSYWNHRCSWKLVSSAHALSSELRAQSQSSISTI